MAIRDEQLLLSSAQVVTTTADSTNTIDTELTTLVPGESWLNVRVAVAMAGGTSIQVLLQDSANNSSFATILSGPVVLTATGIVGYWLLSVQLPRTTRRYLKLNYTIVGTMDTGAAVSAWIGVHPEVLAANVLT